MLPTDAPFAHVTVAELSRRRQGGRPYLEFLRSEALSAGLYELERGAVDRQRPHLEDEVYVVLAGRARFRAAGQDVAVEAGSVLYVAAEEEHRFHSIEQDLQVLVLFAPPESEIPPRER